MSIDARLNKLAPALTAKERAILALRAWKEGEPEDPELRSKMPEGQAAEFNRYISLMNGVNEYLVIYSVLMERSLAHLDTLYSWLLSLHMWALGAMRLSDYIAFLTKEPITKSEHQRRVATAREEMVPASEFAEVLAERYKGWTQEDLEPQEGEDEPLVKPAAWKRVCREKAEELARLVEEGTLAGSLKGRRLYVNSGSFYDWLGEPVPVFPDWGFEFEVMPDNKAKEAQRLREARKQAHEAVEHAPVGLGVEMVSRMLGQSPNEPLGRKGIAEAVSAALREGIQGRWRELMGTERVLEEIAPEFDGEDPAHPRERTALTEGKERLKDLHEKVQEYVGAFDLPGPDDEETDRIRWAIQRAGER